MHRLLEKKRYGGPSRRRRCWAVGHFKVNTVIRGDFELKAIRKLNLAAPGFGGSCALVGKRAGAQEDDALHSGGEDHGLVPIAGWQRAPLRGNVADMVPHVEWRGLCVLIHRTLLD